MDANDLNIFRTVAKTGAISQAAQDLGYVQSNVTARIRHLEERLGARLFYRHNRGVTLTPAGEVLLPYAEKIARLLEEADQAVQNLQSPAGPLAIGAVETAMATRLPALVTAYLRQYPEVELSLISGTTGRLIQEVLQYRLDGAFVSGPVDHPELLSFRVFSDEVVLVSSPSWGDLSSLREAKHLTLLTFPAGCAYRSRLEQMLKEEGIHGYRINEFHSLETIAGYVQAGLGVSLMPRSALMSLKDGPTLCQHSLPHPYGTMDTTFIYRKDTLRTKAFNKFLEPLQTKNPSPNG